ncbi:unnamed protein product [Nezara viridula]|uniref:Uncharacterized protein n=1 Tax=Nezara viridula TaxID=85310 RepID=A0A9P0MMD1_NEZVI|nr:unnamed protein product [Nezara viridula]
MKSLVKSCRVYFSFQPVNFEEFFSKDFLPDLFPSTPGSVFDINDAPATLVIQSSEEYRILCMKKEGIETLTNKKNKLQMYVVY